MAPNTQAPLAKKPMAKATAKVPARAVTADPDAVRGGDAVHTIFTRNAFYQDGYRSLIRIALLQLIAILVLLGILIGYFLFSQPRYRFFATTADGRIIDIVPLDQPYRQDVVAWASQAATEAMTFAYSDYRMRLQAASPKFTTRGWDTYISALNSARIIETMDKRQLNIKGTPGAAPQIVRQGVVNGVYQWVLKFPYAIEYLGVGEKPQPTTGDLTLVVQRVPNLENPDGIGIDQWILTGKQ